MSEEIRSEEFGRAFHKGLHAHAECIQHLIELRLMLLSMAKNEGLPEDTRTTARNFANIIEGVIKNMRSEFERVSTWIGASWRILFKKEAEEK